MYKYLANVVDAEIVQTFNFWIELVLDLNKCSVLRQSVELGFSIALRGKSLFLILFCG